MLKLSISYKLNKTNVTVRLLSLFAPGLNYILFFRKFTGQYLEITDLSNNVLRIQ